MRQEDIVAVLRASDRPMTVREILTALGEEHKRTQLQKALRMLRMYGIVREAGTVMVVPGAYSTLWETVA